MNYNVYLKTYIAKLLLISISCLYTTLFISPVSLYSQIVQTTIDLQENGFPIALTVNSETNLIYVSKVSTQFNVTVIDGATDELIKNINTGLFIPGDIVVDVAANLVYIVDGRAVGYRIINGFTNEVIGTGPSGTIEFCSEPIPITTRGLSIDVNSRTHRIYLGIITAEDCSQIITLNGSNNEMIDSITIQGIEPILTIVNSQTNQIYVEIYNPIDVETDNIIIKIDGETNEISKSVEFDTNTFMRDIDPLTNNIYMGAVSGDNSSVIVYDSNLENIVSTIAVEAPFGSLKLNPTTNHLFLVHQDSNTVSVIDTLTNNLIKTLDVGLVPVSMDINPVTNKVYVVNHSSNSVTVIQDGIDETPLPSITATPTPTPTQPGQTITVNPETAKSSAKFNMAIVTVTDNNGEGIAGVRIMAIAKGLMTKVEPRVAMTDINGNAEFRFRFGFVSKEGQIIFTAKDGLTAVLSQED